jgi:formate dehydrogenase gamma subunit
MLALGALSLVCWLWSAALADDQACLECHADPDLKRDGTYQKGSSVFVDEALIAGSVHEGVACAECHAGATAEHGERLSPAGCASCHEEEEEAYRASQGMGSYAAYLSRTTCARCHDSERIVERYGLTAQRLTTYIDSYHGLADQSGSAVVANCASCHGVHDILPSKDPASSIHRSNLPKTCGKCHPGAGENFALGTIHVDADPGDRQAGDMGGVAIYCVRQFYLSLILVTVLGMAGHNGLDFAKNFAAPRLPRGGEYLRFTRSERVQHGTMALSFAVLAYSGFALKFPEAWWAAPFAWLGAGEDWRRLVHRVAAVAMVGICLYHLGYLAFSRRGREQFREMLPRWQDARDAWQMLRAYLGKSDQHPQFGRFGYVEKLEYWALVWGSAVMTFTGFLLWFENHALRWLPKWGLDVATAIHYYEAWLAVLAIIVWHFYWVIFNPRVYPMSLVWLTGRLSAQAMAEEHPRELEELRRQGREA